MKKLLFLLPLMILLTVPNTVEAKKKKYPNGDYYEGEWKNGKPNGIGKMTYANGDVFERKWPKGGINVNGEMIYYISEAYYEGNWKDGEKDGFGKMIYSNDDVYEGNWKNGKQDGIGKFVYINGNTYEGNWSTGKASGQGKYTDKFKNTFEGYFEDERPRTGKLILIDGGYSEGEFLSSSIIDDIVSLSESCKLYNGTCEKYIQNMGSFTGKVLRGKYDEGKLIMSNGGWLEGKWIEGIFYDGKCSNYVQNKENFTGTILDGKYDEGKLTQSNGGWLEGKWIEGNFYNGTCDGYIGDDHYKGEWKNGSFTGKLKLRSNTTKILSFDGTLIDGMIKEGKVVYKDNSVYEGEFKESSSHQSGLPTEYIPSGKGCLYITDNKDSHKSIIDGIWENGKLIQTANGNIKINNIDYKVSVNKESVTIPYNSKTYTIALPNNYSDICQTLKEELKKLQNTTFIEVKQPGTILSYLPLEKLSTIENLIIVGILNEKDIKVIRDCKGLKNLDLSHTYIAYSPEYMENKEAEGAALGLIFGLMGVALDNNYKDGKVSTNDYQASKALTYVLQSATEFSEAEKNCLIPKHAFEGMRSLKTVKLPLRAVSIEDKAFAGCTNLEIVELPPYLEVLGEEAFADCCKLKIESFPKSIKRIYFGVFKNCSSLTKIDLSACTIKGVFELAIFNGTGLKELHLPNGIESVDCSTTIGGDYSANAHVNKYCNIYFPKSFKRMDEYFTNCVLHFRTQTAPKNSSRIEGNTIYIPKGCTTAYYSAFGNKNSYIEE